MARTAEAFPYQTAQPKLRGMNKAVFASGAVLLIASVIVVAYAVVVQFPHDGCHWETVYMNPGGGLSNNCIVCHDNEILLKGDTPVTTMPMTSEPYLSYGVLLAVVALVTMVIGYAIPK